VRIALAFVLSFFALVALVLWLWGKRGALPSTRMLRMARIGRLWAALATSWLGVTLRRRFAGAERRARVDEARRRADAARVAETMGQMKGAFMKLGQMLSFVSDEVPPEFRAALASLQTAAPAMDFALLRDVAERELEMPLERAFAHIDERPLASASIGQVHRATLPTGEPVVVKIQYPGVAEAIASDLDNAALLYRVIGPMYPNVDHASVVDELRARIGEELDYRNEASNQRAFFALYEHHPFIRVPRVIDSHSSARVLTSELVTGRRFDEIVQLDAAERDRYGEIIFRFVFGSIARYGMFNGDPHPGNYLFDHDGRVAFLDYGCVKRFPQAMLKNWKALVTAHLDEDRAAFVRQLIALDFLPPDTPLDPELLFDYFGYFYEPVQKDAAFTFTREYNARSFKQVFRPEGRAAGLSKALNMPKDFVFVNRIQWGVHSILAHLAATANWHRIHRELVRGAAPATALGELDAEYLRTRVRKIEPQFETG
jgi:predicted unusual protein kinase regulating ubiquinone biosynthesis (AarF/ABC1/UbiB family)